MGSTHLASYLSADSLNYGTRNGLDPSELWRGWPDSGIRGWLGLQPSSLPFISSLAPSSKLQQQHTTPMLIHQRLCFGQPSCCTARRTQRPDVLGGTSRCTEDKTKLCGQPFKREVKGTIRGTQHSLFRIQACSFLLLPLGTAPGMSPAPCTLLGTRLSIIHWLLVWKRRQNKNH